MKKLRVAFLTSDGREGLSSDYHAEPSLGTAPAALLQGLAGCADVEVHVISCARAAMPWPEKLADNIFFHSLRVPKIGWLRTFYQGCIRAVRNKLKEIRPDIVHGQGTERDCAISAVCSGRPNVITIHGNMRLISQFNRARPFSYEWLAARLETFTLPRANGVICITNYTRAAVAGLAKKTWVVPNAVEAGFFDVQPLAPPPPAVLCVGVVCPRKNQNDFIRALDPLAREKQFKIIFLGQVEASAYGGEFWQLLRDRPWCEHAGFAKRDRLKEYFRQASLLALPTREDNCPMTVLEAMAAGVPVLAANVGGVPELIENGRTGLFCDPLDSASMRDGLARLIENRDWARQLAAAAKLEARQRFHPLAVAQRHMEIYREVLAG